MVLTWILIMMMKLSRLIYWIAKLKIQNNFCKIIQIGTINNHCLIIKEIHQKKMKKK
jgi:hypothetical protein